MNGNRKLFWSVPVAAVLLHIALIAISIVEVFIFSIFKSGRPQEFYTQHAEFSGPLVSIFFGFPLFIITARYLYNRFKPDKLILSVSLPIIYTLIDFIIVDAAGVIWEEHILVFAISAFVKLAGSIIGVYFVSIKKVKMVINRTVELSCALDEAWEWLTNFEKLKKWNTDLLEEANISEGDPGPGFKSKVLIKEGSKNNWYENEIIDYQINKRIAIKMVGDNLGESPMIVSYDLETIGDKTQLKFRSEWRPIGFLRTILNPIIVMVANKNSSTLMGNLVKLVNK